ncbi:MAG: BamA/TamA family outer membrane protein [Kofleriaceae bacterium]|nr:BamA/TamA family outer membrane protein [Kofleriaceae bacterium]
MRLALVLLLLTASAAWAQLPDPESSESVGGGVAGSEEVVPTTVDLASCQRYDVTPGALMAPPASAALATPIPWTELELEGRFIESKDTVRRLLEPILAPYRTSLSAATMPQVALLIARFGYQLVGHHTVDLPNGTRLVLELAPLPLVRRVDVKIARSYLGITGIADKPLDDEIRQRMSIRTGTYLPLNSVLRRCQLLEEERRVVEYLHDEGYFEAKVEIFTVMEVSRAEVRVRVTLGDAFTVGKVTVQCPPGTERNKRGRCINPTTNTIEELAISEATIKNQFAHSRFCLTKICFGTAHFNREQHQKDLEEIRKQFRRAGYPGVRVVSTEPVQYLNRKTRTVNPTITIDPRRRVEVEFVGHDPDAIGDGELRGRLTFDAAGSADDVEVENSARAIRTLLQEKGYFDALVTSSRERYDSEPKPGSSEVGVHFDRITFHLSPGRQRRVVSVDFAGNTPDVIKDEDLAKLVETKPNAGRSLFRSVASATSLHLIEDQERIKDAYRKLGYLNAQVYPSASSSKAGLDNPALTATLLATDDRGDLHVRFTIDEGTPTLLSRIVIAGANGAPIDDGLCTGVLGELARVLKQDEIAVRANEPGCVAIANTLPYHVEKVGETRAHLQREYLFKQGRTRSQVELQVVPFGIDRVEARYTLRSPEKLRIGRIVLRGNFKTSKNLILRELGFKEGDSLTSDAISEGEHRLRNTGLFDAVNIEWPDLNCESQQRTCNSEVINAIVRVEERFDNKAEIIIEGGVSSYNLWFGTFRLNQRNLFGRGLRFLASLTLGAKLKEAEGTFRIPPWIHSRLPRKAQFTTDINGVYRQQDTPRFGLLTTQGFGVAITKQWQPWTSHVWNFGLHYDFRLRSRNVDALRPIGADQDESQVAISTRTGSVGATFEWEHRIDREGRLSPFAPEGGWRFEVSGALASPALLGQDTFVKVSGSASKFFLLWNQLHLRIDGRYDQGFPLGGAVLLPEVERFFAGGDPTVRGYADDRLATELVQVGVPPLDNITQIRVIPAGGNIRVLGSIDAALPIWQPTNTISLAGALFTDAGLITNSWRAVDIDDPSELIPTAIRPSVGMGLRALTGFGVGALEYAVPLRPQLGDDPRGRIHFYFAARAQF